MGGLLDKIKKDNPKGGSSKFEFVPTQGSDKWDKGYDFLKATLTAPENEALRKKLYEDWNVDPKNAAKNLTQDQLVSKFLDAQQQIFQINKTYPRDVVENKKWDKGTKKNATYTDAATKLGLTPLSEDDIETFQSAYRTMSDLADNPEFEKTLSQFNLTPIGVSDQTYGKGAKPISPVDGWFGNTTVGQAMIAKKLPEEVPVTEPIKDKEIVPAAQQRYVGQRPDNPFWTQDLVNMGLSTANRLGIKKYMPWAPKLAPQTPGHTFYDPTRELASNEEQMAIGTQGAGLFSGPQAFNARFSEIAGKGAKNAADTLGKYHNLNVNEANRYEDIKAGIYNQADQANAAIASKLYDQTTIANQQFDNSKRQATSEMASAFNNAWTNRGMTQSMNYMYPHYQVDPITGYTYGYKGSNMVPNNVNSYDNQLASIAQDAATYNLDPDLVAKVRGINTGSRGTRDNRGEREAIMEQRMNQNFVQPPVQYSKYGGPRADTWLDKYSKEFSSAIREDEV